MPSSPRFAEQAPLNATRVDENGQAVEDIPATHVVDGLISCARSTADARPRVLQVVAMGPGFRCRYL